MASFALALISAPQVQAGSVWLIMKEAVRVEGSRFALDLEKLEMRDMDQCEEQGAVFMASERMGRDRENMLVLNAWRLTNEIRLRSSEYFHC